MQTADCFVAPDPQRIIDRVRKLNKHGESDRGWKFGASDFSRLADPPQLRGGTAHCILGLGVNLDSIEQTLFEAGAVLMEGRASFFLNPALREPGMDLQLLKGSDDFEPGTLCWLQLDPLAHRDPIDGRTVLDVAEKAVENNTALAHFHIPFVADQNPDWLRVIAERALPPVELGGCRISAPGLSRYSGVPYLYPYDGGMGVHLGVHPVGNAVRSFAAPSVREFR